MKVTAHIYTGYSAIRTALTRLYAEASLPPRDKGVALLCSSEASSLQEYKRISRTSGIPIAHSLEQLQDILPNVKHVVVVEYSMPTLAVKLAQMGIKVRKYDTGDNAPTSMTSDEVLSMASAAATTPEPEVGDLSIKDLTKRFISHN